MKFFKCLLISTAANAATYTITYVRGDPSDNLCPTGAAAPLTAASNAIVEDVPSTCVQATCTAQTLQGQPINKMVNCGVSQSETVAQFASYPKEMTRATYYSDSSCSSSAIVAYAVGIVGTSCKSGISATDCATYVCRAASSTLGSKVFNSFQGSCPYCTQNSAGRTLQINAAINFVLTMFLIFHKLNLVL